MLSDDLKFLKNAQFSKKRVNDAGFLRVKSVPRAATGYAWHQKILVFQKQQKRDFENNEKLF